MRTGWLRASGSVVRRSFPARAAKRTLRPLTLAFVTRMPVRSRRIAVVSVSTRPVSRARPESRLGPIR